MATAHVLAWLVYALAVAVGMLAAWRLSRRWRPAFRDLVRGVLAGVLLTPWPVVVDAVAGGESGTGDRAIAPAFVVIIFEAIFQQEGDAVAATAAMLGVILCILTLTLAWRLRGRQRGLG